MKPFRLFLPVLCLIVTCAAAQEKEAADGPFYKLDFVVKEVEAGKIINSRNFSAIQSASGKARSSIRTGARVPVQTGEKSFQFIDIGVSIDFNQLHELPGDRIAIELGFDISSNAASENAPHPIIRQNKWQSTVMMPVRKATTIFTSDDPTSKRTMQIEMTATPLK